MKADTCQCRAGEERYLLRLFFYRREQYAVSEPLCSQCYFAAEMEHNAAACVGVQRLYDRFAVPFADRSRPNALHQRRQLPRGLGQLKVERGLGGFTVVYSCLPRV